MEGSGGHQQGWYTSASMTREGGLRSWLLWGVYTGLCYYAAYTLMGYGFAKVMGAQFTVLDSELDRPMGQVSGFWLTWYYFGYSPIYSGIVAGAQIGGAVLLCFRRTALVGVLILLPVMVNIVAIDLWVMHWHWSNDALRNAVYVLTALLCILAFQAKDIFEFVMRQGTAMVPLGRWRWGLAAAQIVLVCGMIAYTAREMRWIANVNNRAPTPIDGAWRVTDVQPVTEGVPKRIYFEYNRAYMCVFLMPDGTTESHDFRTDPSSRSINISRHWLTPGSEIFQGSWERDGNLLRLSGKWKGSVPLVLVLNREQMKAINDR